MPANLTVAPATTFFKPVTPERSNFSFSLMSKILKGVLFACLIEGAQANNVTSPFAFIFNATLFAFLTDRPINPDVRDSNLWKNYWQFFTNMVDKVTTEQLGNNGTVIADYVPGLKTIWSGKTCLLKYNLQSNGSAADAVGFVKKFADEFKSDDLYKALQCGGWQLYQTISLICVVAVMATMIALVSYRPNSQSQYVDIDGPKQQELTPL